MFGSTTGAPSTVAPSTVTRINWGAVFAGSALAFGFHLLFASLGAAVGLSISEHVKPSTLHVSAVAWAFVTTVGAFFVGGMMTSLLTPGENRVEAILHGVLVWAVVLAVLVGLGVAGARSGITAMIAMGHAAPGNDWETAARNAGVAPEQLESLRRSMSAAAQREQGTQNEQELSEDIRRVSWYAFAGIWGSMVSAAIGGLTGAGPMFRTGDRRL